MKNRTTVCDKEYRLKSICSIMSYNIISYNTTGKFIGAVATIIAKTKFIKKELIKSCFSHKIKTLKLGKNYKYVEHPLLDILQSFEEIHFHLLVLMSL